MSYSDSDVANHNRNLKSTLQLNIRCWTSRPSALILSTTLFIFSNPLRRFRLADTCDEGLESRSVVQSHFRGRMVFGISGRSSQDCGGMVG